MKHIGLILFSSFLFLVAACGDNVPVIEVEEDQAALVKENMINANRVVIQSETTQIDNYIQRRGWKTATLPCGASYWQYAQGGGKPVLNDDEVVVTYRLEALDGSTFYTNQKDTLVVGRHEVTVALYEVLLQLHYGSKAWLVAPSNAAYGVVGDGDRVPSRAVIIYNIENICKI